MVTIFDYFLIITISRFRANIVNEKIIITKRFKLHIKVLMHAFNLPRVSNVSFFDCLKFILSKS